MTTVREVYENLHSFVEAGFGGVELIAVDSRNGVSSNVNILADVTIHKSEQYDIGTLDDFPEGDCYVTIHLDH